MKVLHSTCQHIWKTQQWPQDWKRSVFIPIPKKGNAKECSDYHTIALISHTSKLMLKILQASFQQYMDRELPDVQAGFRKGRGTRDQIANILWIMEKASEFQKNIYFCFIDYAKSFELSISKSLIENFQMYKLGFKEAEEPEIKLPAFVGSWRKQGNSRKNIYFCFIDYTKAFV